MRRKRLPFHHPFCDRGKCRGCDQARKREDDTRHLKMVDAAITNRSGWNR